MIFIIIVIVIVQCVCDVIVIVTKNSKLSQRVSSLFSVIHKEIKKQWSTSAIISKHNYLQV